ncbi:MAG: hypothetical protein IJS92_04000 [Paludibacteraceae bacterium]|nr:hypothetical protein [Paludibacteraceae bacterium]
MKKIYVQPRIETKATTPQQMLCTSGGIKAQISGYKQNTGGGFIQSVIMGIACSSLLFLGTACSTTNNPDQPKQQAELKPRTLIVTQSAVNQVTPESAVRRLPQATITENGGALDAIWSVNDEISFRNMSHKEYTDPETGNPVYLEGVLLADRAASIASFASNDKVWCDLGDQILLVYPKATAPAFEVDGSGSSLTASYSISLIGQDGTLDTIASTYHHSYGIATITEVTPTVANAVVAEMQNLLTVCKFSFVDKEYPGTLLPITSLSISYGDGTYANTYPEQATVTVTQGTPCTATVTPDKKSTSAGGYALSVVPTGNPTEVYVALLPEATATTYSFSLTSGENTYTGTATARLIAGEYVVATNLKLTKVNH